MTCDANVQLSYWHKYNWADSARNHGGKFVKDVEIEATEPVQRAIVQCAKGGNRHVLGFSGV